MTDSVPMLLTYHKGLSRFFRRVFPTPMHGSSGQMLELTDYIMAGKTKYLLSVHNPTFDPYRKVFEKCRIAHIIRHPKDFIVSGYHYHKRGAEEWTKSSCKWDLIQSIQVALADRLSNTDITYLDQRPSLYEILNYFDFENGMMVEILWRKHRQRFFPLGYYRHPDIATFRFEEIVPDMPSAVEQICRYYQMSDRETEAALLRAKYETKDPGDHVRNPSSYQYQTEFTPAITDFFNSEFYQLPELLDYQA